MSADLFEFQRRGDGCGADEEWREREADTAEPEEECGLLLSTFFIQCHINHSSAFSTSSSAGTFVTVQFHSLY